MVLLCSYGFFCNVYFAYLNNIVDVPGDDSIHLWYRVPNQQHDYKSNILLDNQIN